MIRPFRLRAGAFVLLTSLCAFAGVRPSFMLDYSSWHATNIVVVTPVSDEGKFQVLESWKGDLLPGVVIAVPDLKPSAESQPIEECVDEDLAQPFGKKCRSIPIAHPGTKIVLYLGDVDKPAKTGKWSASDLFGDMKASAVWVHNGKAHGFRQIFNPGDSVFVQLSYLTERTPAGERWEPLTEASLKEKTFNVLHVEQQVTEATAIQDPKARAEALRPFADSKIRPAGMFVLEQLGKCGEAALPTIRSMLDDPKFADIAFSLVEQYANAGGAAAGPELNSRLEADLRYWQSVGPALPAGWWSTHDEVTGGPRSDGTRERYSQTLALVRALDKLRYQPASPTAMQLRDFWRSWPQLNDPSGMKQMADEADQLVKNLQSTSSEVGAR